MNSKLACLLAGLALALSAPASAADWYVDGSAPPGGDGSFGNPFRTIQDGLDVAMPGDTVFVRGGTYSLTSPLSFPRSGSASQRITLKAYDDETVLVERNPAANTRLLQTSASYITIEGIIFDGNYGTQNGLLRFDGGSGFVMRNCEVRRHGNHMVRLDNDDFLMEDCHIHHAIVAGSPSVDAHTLHSQTGFGHTFRRCDIHHATGDLWQGSTDGPWGDIVFEQCDLHIELADDDSNGISPGTAITENHLDTKDSGTVNFNLTVRDSIIFGSVYSRTSVGGALNLKQQVSGLVIAGNLIYGNRTAFRLRYPSTDYLIYNNLIFQNDAVFRLEDGISGLQIYNNTFFNNNRIEYDAGAAPGTVLFKNNIFSDSSSSDWHGAYEYNLFWRVPGGWPAGTGNIAADPLFVDPAASPPDLHLQAGSPAIDAGLYLPIVAEDFDGQVRPQGDNQDMGAYEFPAPPTPPTIVPVQPQPEPGYVAIPYARQMSLSGGTPPVQWALLQGPAGLTIDADGWLSGWTPDFQQLDDLITIEVEASNGSGSDTEQWQVLVSPAPPVFLEQDGLLVLEAENYDLKTDGSAPVNDAWVLQSGSGAVGDYMESLPDDGTKVDSDIEATSPLLGFKVYFTRAGTYYLWLRGWGADGAGDSVHHGLDGASISHDFDSAPVVERIGAFAWRSNTGDGGRPTIQIGSPGLHEIDIWMREDGVRLDRILLTLDPSFAPTDQGPAESPRTAGITGDLDRDADVDLLDVALLDEAFSGPGIPTGNPRADLDGDGDCDLDDYDLLAAHLIGPR